MLKHCDFKFQPNPAKLIIEVGNLHIQLSTVNLVANICLCKFEGKIGMKSFKGLVEIEEMCQILLKKIPFSIIILVCETRVMTCLSCNMTALIHKT